MQDVFINKHKTLKKRNILRDIIKTPMTSSYFAYKAWVTSYENKW